MKDRIVTNSFRAIKRSFSRFLPLLVISFLGVFVFAGLQSIRPDMLTTLDQFLDQHDVYDFEIVSTGGLTSEDIEALNQLNSVLVSEGSYYVDTLVDDQDNEIVVRISSMPQEINRVDLLSGRLPQNEGEIVVEQNFLEKTHYQLEDHIILEDDSLKSKEYTIVGTVLSALYFNNDTVRQNRGTTTIGTGTIHYYAYVLDREFVTDYYHQIYVQGKDMKDLLTSEKNYLEAKQILSEQIYSIKDQEEQRRYDFLYHEAEAKILDEEKKLNDELGKAKQKLDQAKKTLDQTKKTLDQTKKQLSTYQSSLDEAKKTIDSAFQEYEQTLQKLGMNEEQLLSQVQLLNEKKKELNEFLENQDPSSSTYETYALELKKLEEQILYSQSLIDTKEALQKKRIEYETQRNQYETMQIQYQKGWNSYQKGNRDYQSNLSLYQEQKRDAEKKIQEAKEQLQKIEVPEWYIYDRSHHETYADYIDDVTSVDNLSQIFPIVFFAVSILVSLISMNRMVEEERIEIGTLKSLGFSDHQILYKYFLFSFLATIIGGLLGGLLGIWILPSLVFSIYGMLFHVPNFVIHLNFDKILFSLFLSFLCIGGTTIFTVNKVVHEKPSELMRPKAPKNGKRIFLERWKGLWKKIRFSNKVTLRNLLRYKKRGLVTILGITGCASLMLCGFGIRDAIIDIANLQFKETFTYDAMVYKENGYDLPNYDLIQDDVGACNKNVHVQSIQATFFIADREEIPKIVHLQNKENESLSLEKNKIVITDKLADLLHVGIGDTLTFMDDDNQSYDYEISGIAKNYLMHYIYLDRESFEEKYPYEENVSYLTFQEMNEEMKEQFSNELLDNEEVYNLTYTEEFLESTHDMLTSLNKVVLIILFLSAALSFVVLYNLSNINIQERKREISTLKVLGFYDQEVDRYITKENIIFTIFGILLGFIGGYFLTHYVITTVEIEKARFIHHISFSSYLYTALITLFFTWVVNVVIHFHLKKIDMIASLKSVD